MPEVARITRSSLVAVTLVVLVGAAAYSGSFAVPFQLDDPVVLGDPAVADPAPASRRFLGDLSFAVTARLLGPGPAPQHAVNLAIHLVNALLVLWLVRLLWRTPRVAATPPAHAGRLALVAALVFVAHPLQTQAVTYVAQRYASLAATFYLLATCAYLRARLAMLARGERATTGGPTAGASGARGWTPLPWYALFLAAAVAAVWTKENAAVIPLSTLLLELAFFTGTPRQRLALFSPFLAAAAGAAAWAAASGIDLEALSAATRVDTDLPRSHYALTQLRVVAAYLRLFLLPAGQSVDHHVPVSTSLFEPRVLAALALHGGLLAAALAAVRAPARPARRVAGFGVLWFYVALLVESSVIPIVDVMFEHRVYLPSVGLVLAGSGLLALAPGALRGRGAAALAAVVALLAAATFERNRVWGSELSLWSDAAAKAPRKARPLNNVGVALFERGDVRGAVEWYERAIAADPGYSKARFNLGEAYQRLGACDRAIPQYRRFAAEHPDFPDTWANLALCLQATGDPEGAARARAMAEALRADQAGRPPDPFFR